MRLRELRERRGMKLRELARKTGINPGILHRVETGERPIGMYVGKLRKVLGPEVEEMARPGQIALALDWTRAVREQELEAAALVWLRSFAQLHDLEAVEVWRLPNGARPYYVFAPAGAPSLAARLERPGDRDRRRGRRFHRRRATTSKRIEAAQASPRELDGAEGSIYPLGGQE